MPSKRLVRNCLLSMLMFAVLLAPALSAAKAPGKLLFEDVFFPAAIDDGENLAFFKLNIKDSTADIRLTLGDPETGESRTLLPDLDFSKRKIMVFAFTPDNQKVAIVDRNLTPCDIWLYDRNEVYAEPIRLTDLEQFDPGYPVEDLYEMGLSPRDVLSVTSMDFSPDGTDLLMTFGIVGKTAIWLYEMDRDHYRQMTRDRVGYLPNWLSDGERFVYVKSDTSSGKFSENLYIMTAANNESEPLVITTYSDSWPAPSPDGKYVAFMRSYGDQWNCHVVRLSDRKTAQITDLPAGASCNYGDWSGDSSKLYLLISGFGDNKHTDLFEVDFTPDKYEWQ